MDSQTDTQPQPQTTIEPPINQSPNPPNKTNSFNIDPEDPDSADTFLKERLARSPRKWEELETEVVPAPFVEVCVCVYGYMFICSCIDA